MPHRIQKLSDKVTRNLNVVKKRLNLSLRRIASATNKSFSTIGFYFRGVKNPTEDWIDIFCSVYCVDKDWLITGDGDPVFTGEPNKSVLVRSSEGVGARIREVRENAGLSQREFGEKIGMTSQGVFYLEKNKTAPTSFSVARIEDEFDVGADWLMYGDNGKKNFPVSKKLIDWLWKNEDERKRLWERMTGHEIINSLNDYK